MSFVKEPGAVPFEGHVLIEPLGTGGFGEVWKCTVPGGLFKAIKFVFGNLNSLDFDRQRAEQEMDALQRIKEVRHPFVLSTERIEIRDGEVAIVMELADKSLHDAFTESLASGMVGIPRDTLLRYLRDAAEALDHMSEKHNLQHLDVKPRNLFLISDRVKVADFGLVKHLERQNSSGLMGGVTPLYAPPETFDGKITSFSDQYSLAIVYQELLTGQRPFTGKNVRQLAQQHMTGEPELRPLPEAERPVVARALSKDPEKRFPNCLAFVRALYTAQGRIRPESVAALTMAASGVRPKTLSETLEDIDWELPDDAESKSPISGAAEKAEPNLGITIPQPQHGALRPTLIVGLGSFGRRALFELRCRILDRFGDMRKIPLVRFLYVDSDPDAIRLAQTGAPEVALSRNEIQHLPLLPVVQYRKRMLDHLLEWLPREKLYAMPRSLQTQGSRGLGRLALVDNHLRLQARLRREIQHITHPDALYQSVSRTGLALRDSVPRICVLAAGGGGASGCLIDLAYTLRHVLTQLKHEKADSSLFLFCGAPTDPATPRQDLANLYATLTELNHFMDPNVPFTAQYGADGPRTNDSGEPFRCTYIVQTPQRGPECLRVALGHVGSYLFHELTTPLGSRLEQDRRRKPPMGEVTSFRSFGTAAVWFPRGLLLRTAARQACHRLIDTWQATGDVTLTPEIEATCARALSDAEFRPENFSAQLESGSAIHLEGKPAEALTSMLSGLEEQSQQSVAQDDPGSWARQALSRVKDWTGMSNNPLNTLAQPSSSLSEWQRSRLSRAMKASAEKLAEKWDKLLAKAAYSLMEQSGRRVSAAEIALNQFLVFAHEGAANYGAKLLQQSPGQQQAWSQLESALEACLAGPSSFSLFGSRSRRNLRLFMDRLTVFARQRLAEETLAAGQQVYLYLRGRLTDRIRDLSLIRQRLRHLQEQILSPGGGLEGSDKSAERRSEGHSHHQMTPLPTTAALWEAIRGASATTRVVLPDGVTDLEKAASNFLNTISSEQWVQLDQGLQDRVMVHLGGLYEACMKSVDLAKFLAGPLVEQAATMLGEHLPTTDVAQIELSSAESRGQDIMAQIKKHWSDAKPFLCPDEGVNETSFLLIPASDAGKTFGDRARSAFPQMQLVRVSGQAHLMLCREQGYVSMEELHPLLEACRPAYDRVVTAPPSSPHSRFDIVDWMPLDPTT